MRRGFYFGFAKGAIKKNKKLYYPYMLSCLTMISMFYVIMYLSITGQQLVTRGSGILSFTLLLGAIVIVFFSALFLFYTNSFLLKRRNKEYGLYNVLGMTKTDIFKILFWETAIIGASSLLLGMLSGIATSKLFELLLVKIIDATVTFSFKISAIAIIATILVYVIIFIGLYVKNCYKIAKADTITIMNSDSYGEQAPKANWLLGLGGIVLMGFAYWIALSVQSPIESLIKFFAAVVMVEAATFMIFICGSVLLCHILQKDKSFYYKTQNFISVSSLKFRMKRNGAGLASICILATMALVTVSTTSCLYYGSNDSLKRLYPRDASINYVCQDYASLHQIADEGTIQNIISEHEGTSNYLDCYYVSFAGYLEKDTFQPDHSAIYDLRASTYKIIKVFKVIPTAELETIIKENIELKDDECILLTGQSQYDYETLNIVDVGKYNVNRTYDIGNDELCGFSESNALQLVVMAVNDVDRMAENLNNLAEKTQTPLVSFTYRMMFDVAEKELDSINSVVDECVDDILNSIHEEFSIIYGSRENDKLDFYNSFGGLFFVGMILSGLFMVGTVLIIYYKQITEGYEDRRRFSILQKVGISRKEIRKSVNRQMLMIFFLPVFMAIVHLCFAFRMIEQIIFIFNVSNRKLLLTTTSLSVLVFVIIYIFVYLVTSNAYYRIVLTVSLKEGEEC